MLVSFAGISLIRFHGSRFKVAVSAQGALRQDVAHYKRKEAQVKAMLKRYQTNYIGLALHSLQLTENSKKIA